MLLLSPRQCTPGSNQHRENPVTEYLLQTHSQIRMQTNICLQTKNPTEGKEPLPRRDTKYQAQSHPTSLQQRVSLSWVTYTPSWEFPIPANLFPQKQDQPLPPAQPNQLTPAPLLPIPKSTFLDMPGWHCSPCSLPSQSIPSLLLSHFPKKRLWRQLDVPPQLSGRQHSPKHHFPKHPHQQLFLTQPKAFPRAASTFLALVETFGEGFMGFREGLLRQSMSLPCWSSLGRGREHPSLPLAGSACLF